MPPARGGEGGPGGDAPVIIGESPPVRALLAEIARVGPTDATVLIVGERGSGKELVAQALREASRRRERPFVTINCGALPRELLASELFGHERGAFTNALERHPGLFTLADGGTLFADEIGNLPLDGQGMLLRAIEQGEVRPVGGKSTTHVDVRLIAATNKNLSHAIAAGDFLPDLHDRLAEVVLEVPPLRARRDDIPLLVEHFVGTLTQQHGVDVRGVSHEAWRVLESHDWPGNVRELINVLSRAVIFADGAWIRPEDLRLPERHDEDAPGMNGDRVRRPDGHGDVEERVAAILDMARRRGRVYRSDVASRLGVSRETARKVLQALVAARRLRPEGTGRGARYVLA